MIFPWFRFVWLWAAVAVGIIAACFGARWAWRGITHDIRKDTFGEPLIPRWLHVTIGIVCAVAGAALVAFIVWHWRTATAR